MTFQLDLTPYQAIFKGVGRKKIHTLILIKFFKIVFFLFLYIFLFLFILLNWYCIYLIIEYIYNTEYNPIKLLDKHYFLIRCL